MFIIKMVLIFMVIFKKFFQILFDKMVVMLYHKYALGVPGWAEIKP